MRLNSVHLRKLVVGFDIARLRELRILPNTSSLARLAHSATSVARIASNWLNRVERLTQKQLIDANGIKYLDRLNCNAFAFDMMRPPTAMP